MTASPSRICARGSRAQPAQRARGARAAPARAPRAAARAGAARARAPRRRRRARRAPGGAPTRRARDRGGSDRTRPPPRPAGGCPDAVHQRRWVASVRCASLARQVGTARRGTRAPRRSPPRASRPSAAGAARWPIGDRVDDAAAPAVLARERRPVHVQPPAHPQLREGQQTSEASARRTPSPGRSPRSSSRARRCPAGGASPPTRRGSAAGARAAPASARSARRGTGSGRGSRAGAPRRRRRRAASRIRRAGCSASSRLRFSNLPRSRPVRLWITSWRERASSAAIARLRRARSGRSTLSASSRRRGGERRAARSAAARARESSSPRRREVVRDPAPQGVDPPDRPALAREEIGIAPGGSRLGVRSTAAPALCAGVPPRGECLAQPPSAVGDHRQARRAAAPQHVPETAGEREELGAGGRRAPAAGVEAPRRAPAGVGARASERRRASSPARRCSTRGARARSRTRAPSRRAQAFLPLLLVAGPRRATRRTGPTRSSALRRIAMFAPHA